MKLTTIDYLTLKAAIAEQRKDYYRTLAFETLQTQFDKEWAKKSPDRTLVDPMIDILREKRAEFLGQFSFDQLIAEHERRQEENMPWQKRKTTPEDFKAFENVAKFWKLTKEELAQKIIDITNANYTRTVRADAVARYLINQEKFWNETGYIREFLNACKTPEGSKCEQCGKLNLQYDDCGYFDHGNGCFCHDCGTPNTCER